MNEELSLFIERMGLLWEAEGLPRIAGRIYAVALLSPRPTSLDEIADGLGVSKASVSNDARLLEKLGFVERIGLPGDRKTYYQITCDSMARTLSTRIARLRLFQETIVSGVELPVETAVRARLKSHEKAYRTVIRSLEDAVAELESAGNSPTKRSRRS